MKYSNLYFLAFVKELLIITLYINYSLLYISYSSWKLGYIAAAKHSQTVPAWRSLSYGKDKYKIN